MGGVEEGAGSKNLLKFFVNIQSSPVKAASYPFECFGFRSSPIIAFLSPKTKKNFFVKIEFFFKKKFKKVF